MKLVLLLTILGTTALVAQTQTHQTHQTHQTQRDEEEEDHVHDFVEDFWHHVFHLDNDYHLHVGAWPERTCSPDHLSQDQKLDLLVRAQDHDHDGYISTEEMLLDYRTRYDTNRDGQVSEQEWIARYTCAYGDSAYFARFSFASEAGGKESLSLTNFAGDDLLASLSSYTNTQVREDNKARYERFHREGCVNHDLSLTEKLQRYVNRDNDRDHDNLVSTNDFRLDWNNYDVNGDDRITLKEHVLGWVCFYGDSVEFARYVYNVAWGLEGRDHFTLQDISVPPYSTGGMPVHDFYQQTKAMYDNYSRLNHAASLVG